MKKLLPLLFVFIACSAQADELIDAIKDTNFVKVQNFLQDKNISELDLKVALEIANDIMKMRKNEMRIEAFGWLETDYFHRISGKIEARADELIFLSGGGAMMAIGAQRLIINTTDKYALHMNGFILVFGYMLYSGAAKRLKDRLEEYGRKKFNESIDIKALIMKNMKSSVL